MSDAPICQVALPTPFRLLAKFTFPTIVFCSTLRIGPYLFETEKFITQFKTTEKKDRSPYSFARK